ncbi:unnamed protein product [Microthlaspi erraticum]|uniref:Uncharacterized protein n=1 Tax=Microthlaspi erraticum TaxID=1685480 RepID=A0A6D2KFZ7_9BRAS|nr:unnamed protein product [Microthlaspi erraticum]
MPENTCERLEGKTWKKYILWAFLGLIGLVAFVVLLIWAILHPHAQHFVLRDVTVYDFNISLPNYVTSNIQVSLSSKNPNDRIGIFYPHVNVYASYRNQEVTMRSLMPITYQGHDEESAWSPVLKGFGVPVEPYLSESLYQDLNNGALLLDIKVDGCVKFIVGSWVSACYRLRVDCPAFLTSFGHFDSPEISSLDRSRRKMSSASSSSSTSAREFELEKEIKRQEVSIDELSSLSSSRSVYQKTGNLFFLTTSEKAKTNAQKQLDFAKSEIDKIRSQA